MDITAQELKEKLARNEKFVFIDVREPHEYEAYNINADLIPLGSLNTVLTKYADNKQDEIVVCCRSGARSAVARDFLQQNGFTNVRNLLGGLMAWREINN